MKHIQATLFSVMLAFTLALTACGGGGGGSSDNGGNDTPPVAVSIDIAPRTATIQTGQTLDLTATANRGGVIWPTIAGATLTPNGNTATFTSNTPGTYTITIVSDEDATQTATAAITVTAPPPTPISITLTPPSATLGAGASLSLDATVSQGNVVWQTSGGTLTPNGLSATFTSNTPGSYTVIVTATDDASKTASAAITVTPAVDTISLNPSSVSLTTGETQTLTASIDGGTGAGGVTWQTTGGTLTPDANNGLTATFSAATAGSYIVTITSTLDSSKTATATITVTAPTPISIDLTPSATSVQTGGTVTLTATVSQGSVTWPTAINNATLTPNNGLTADFTSNTPGVYTVTVTSTEDASKTATATITVTAPSSVSISIAPSAPSVKAGDTLTLTATVNRGGVIWPTAIAGATLTPNGNSADFTSNTPGSYTVTVTSDEDSAQTATATITVTSANSNSIGMEFVLIPAGQFIMGSAADAVAQNEEKPAHQVAISKPFYLGKYEVTQAQWEAMMVQGESNPSYYQGTGMGNNPVERVSWNDVQVFIQRLNLKEGHNRYRLPTEAEWEYAARAGTTTRYSFGDDASELGQYAWYSGNSNITQPVGQKLPNAWGLYDMHGNVWEWVQDWYSSSYYSVSSATDPSGPTTGSYRVQRGCASGYPAEYCGSAVRGFDMPGSRSGVLGFRLALSPE